MSKVVGHDFNPCVYSGLFGSSGYRINELINGKKEVEFPEGIVRGVEEFFGLGHSFLVLEERFSPIKGISDNNRDILKAIKSYNFIVKNYSRSVKRVEWGDFKETDQLFRYLIQRNGSLRTLKRISEIDRDKYEELSKFYIYTSMVGDEERVRKVLYADDLEDD